MATDAPVRTGAAHYNSKLAPPAEAAGRPAAADAGGASLDFSDDSAKAGLAG